MAAELKYSPEEVRRIVNSSFWLGLFLPGIAQALAQRGAEGVAWLGALVNAWLWLGWKGAVTVHLLSAFRALAIMMREGERYEAWRARTSARTPGQKS